MSTGSRTGLGNISIWRIVAIVALVLLVIGSGVFAYVHFQTISQQTSAGSPTAATDATSIPNLANMSAQQLYTYVMSKPPTLADPLDGSQAGNWDNGPGCQFKQNAFRLTASPSLPVVTCFLRNEFVQDFAFQVQVEFGALTNITETQECSILFRTHFVQQESYGFAMHVGTEPFNQFTYSASFYINNHPTFQLLKRWQEHVPHQVNVFNTLTVIAVHQQINFYINDQFKETVTDSTFRGGQIGLEGGSSYLSPLSLNPFEVIYQNMKLWNLNQG